MKTNRYIASGKNVTSFTVSQIISLKAGHISQTIQTTDTAHSLACISVPIAHKRKCYRENTLHITSTAPQHRAHSGIYCTNNTQGQKTTTHMHNETQIPTYRTIWVATKKKRKKTRKRTRGKRRGPNEKENEGEDKDETKSFNILRFNFCPFVIPQR